MIKFPTTTEELTAFAHHFEKIWQFPRSCGALDGKHVAVTCPWKLALCTYTTIDLIRCPYGTSQPSLKVGLFFFVEGCLFLALLDAAVVPVTTMGMT